MSKRLIAALLGAGALAVEHLTAGVQGADAAAPHLTHLSGLHAQRVCAKTPAAGHAACYARVLVNRKGAVPMATAPLASALSPTQLRERLQPQRHQRRRSHGRDRRRLRLPEPRARPRHLPRPVRPAGLHDGQRLPARSSTRPAARACRASTSGWAQEQALDVDAVSAACPDCKIVDGPGQDRRRSPTSVPRSTPPRSRPACVAISNSYGGGDAPDSTYGAYYNHPGIAVTASTGDNGYQGGMLPGVLVVRHRRRRHVADDVRQHPRLERDRVERRGLRLLDATTPRSPRPRRSTPAAPSGRWRTCPPRPTRTPAA